MEPFLPPLSTPQEVQAMSYWRVGQNFKLLLYVHIRLRFGTFVLHGI
jgi:hypothetical protein